MAYTLQAIVGKEGTLFSDPTRHLQVVPLDGGVEMIPIGRDVLKAWEMPFCPLTDEGCAEVPSSVVLLCERMSQGTTIAYVEAEIFGGAGTQAHVIFSNGAQAGKPLVANDAINQALRHLGVNTSDSRDEFEVVGLGKQRGTDEWLK